jgi:hypothetical protein
MNRHQFAELLNQEAVAGRIIKDVAVLDWLLGDVIAVYFTSDLPRYAAFSELVLSGMSFHQKIEVLKESSSRSSIVVWRRFTRFSASRRSAI